MRKTIINDIFNIKNNNNFNEVALKVFEYQYNRNEIYNKYCNLINVDINKIKNIEDIPFLPILFFKTQKVSCEKLHQKVFVSSGTTSNTVSSHFVYDLKIYKKAFYSCFQEFYGKSQNYAILALLPSYLERKNSSLVYMCENMIKTSLFSESSFYLNEYEKLLQIINYLLNKKQKVLLIGISYALIEFSENISLKNTENLIVMETGGTKGMKKEITKLELHNLLSKNFNVNKIHSEYGMTELFSQAYSKEEGIYETPSIMKVFCRDINNPLKIIENNKTGIINIIDLANIDSCSFIATDDLGIKLNKNSFKIIGRVDNSDVKGCNLLLVNE